MGPKGVIGVKGQKGEVGEVVSLAVGASLNPYLALYYCVRWYIMYRIVYKLIMCLCESVFGCIVVCRDLEETLDSEERKETMVQSVTKETRYYHDLIARLLAPESNL